MRNDIRDYDEDFLLFNSAQMSASLERIKMFLVKILHPLWVFYPRVAYVNLILTYRVLGCRKHRREEEKSPGKEEKREENGFKYLSHHILPNDRDEKFIIVISLIAPQTS